jgi:hypothetical protein
VRESKRSYQTESQGSTVMICFGFTLSSIRKFESDHHTNASLFIASTHTMTTFHRFTRLLIVISKTTSWWLLNSTAILDGQSLHWIAVVLYAGCTGKDLVNPLNLSWWLNHMKAFLVDDSHRTPSEIATWSVVTKPKTDKWLKPWRRNSNPQR